MTLEVNEIYELLFNKLSPESKWFLFVLYKERGALNKERLRNVANNQYQKFIGNSSTNLIVSRHGLDIHTARLEGAGLVHVEEIGRIRMYSLSKLGKELLAYLTISSRPSTSKA